MDLLEIILYVDDMAGQVAFYRDKLGLTVSYPAEADDYSGEMWVTFATGGCTLALHGGGTPEAVPHASKIVFHVEDVEQARAELMAKGVELGAIIEAAPGVRLCNGTDPEGNPFSIEEQH